MSLAAVSNVSHPRGVRSLSSSSSRARAKADEELLKAAVLFKLEETADIEAVDEEDLSRKLAGVEGRAKWIFKVKETFGSERRLLMAIKERFIRVGLIFPAVAIKYTDLTVERVAVSGKSALPSLLSVFTQMCACKRKKKIKALSEASGRFKPGKCTLVLGSPGSGKSTLMQALSGRISASKMCKVSGLITYNDHEATEVQMKKTSSYIDQVDRHIPTLTVTETLDYATILQGVGEWRFLLEEAFQREAKMKMEGRHVAKETDEILDRLLLLASNKKIRLGVDFTIDVLGLSRCANTIVGDSMIRGCSGGERKRVTTGEMYVGPARAMFFDEISTGLDSASTFQVVESIVSSCHFTDMVAVVSLLQPEQQVYDLFDEVLVLAEGQVIYHGPRDSLLDHFEGIGFVCPSDMTSGDFVQSITSRKDQAHLRTDRGSSADYVPVERFVEAWQQSPIYKALMEEIDSPVESQEQFTKKAIVSEKFHLRAGRYFKTLLDRELTLLKRNFVASAIRVMQAVLLGATCGLLFWQRPSDSQGAGNIIGALAFGLNFINMQSIATVSSTFESKPIFYKQRDNFFFPGYSLLMPQVLTALPSIVAESIAFSLLVYFMMGLTYSPSAFFMYLLVVVLMDLLADQLYRTLGIFFNSMPTANAVSTGVLLVLQLTNGLTIVRTSIPEGWIWAYWISPFSWSLRSLVTNEFLQERWVSNGIGPVVLDSFGMFQDYMWVWYGAFFIAGAALLMLVVSGLCFMFTKPPEQPAALLEEPAGPEAIVNIKYEGGAAQEDTKLSFQPMTLIFSNLSYYVPKPGGEKGEQVQLLHNIYGAFCPGVLTALMGSSGAGKTTLMDVIAGRKTAGYKTGDIFVNRFPKKEQTFARVIGYVEQNDLHSQLTTVGEALEFSAMLRLPQFIPNDKKKAYVKRIASMVELYPLWNSLVGEPGVTGLSTEQRKRLTIAVELVANPSIIFMDEPTSGLDARAAAVVMRVVKSIGLDGRTVVCTIHQPSIAIFKAFDELLLLKRGGHTVFYGKLGLNAHLMVDYFQALGPLVPRYKEGQNPSAWMLEVLGGPQISQANYPDLAEEYCNSVIFQDTKEKCAELAVPEDGAKPLTFDKAFATSFFSQLKEVMKKGFTQYCRNPSYITVRLAITAGCGLIFGTMYFGLGQIYDTQTDILNIMGCLYAMNVLLGLLNGFSVQEVVAKERVVYFREHSANAYGPLPAALGQALVEIPFLAVQSVLYVSISYWMVGFAPSAGKFLFFMLTNFLNILLCTFFGQLLVNCTPSLGIAALSMAYISANWDLFAGFYIPAPSMPKPFLAVYYLNPMAYVLYALAASQLGDITSTVQVLSATGDLIDVPVNEYLANNYGIERFGIPGMWGCVIILGCFSFVFMTGSYLGLRFLNFMTR